MGLSSITGKLTCDMRVNCQAAVTHVGAKGYAYCTPHAAERQSQERCRAMRKWEIRHLEAGEVLPSYKPIRKPKTAAALSRG